MDRTVQGALLQTATPVAGVGPEELAGYWPSLVRVAWFAVGFLAALGVGLYVVEPAITRIVSRRNRNNPTVQEAISRYVRLVVVVLAVYVAAGVAGYTRFLTDSALVIAAGTLAVGVAAQSVIGSLASGIVLVLDPEFNVGNYIEWADGEGTIRSITLRVTRVQTQDGELVTIPNTLLTSQTITRPYGQGRYRVVEHVGIAYEDDVEEALAHLEAAAGEVESVLDAPGPDGHVAELGDDAVVLRVHYWVDDPTHRDVFTVRSRYASRVKDRLEAADITISPATKRDLQGRIEVGDPV